MSLKMQFETEKICDVDGIKDARTYEATLNMNEGDELWVFIKSQVDFYG